MQFKYFAAGLLALTLLPGVTLSEDLKAVNSCKDRKAYIEALAIELEKSGKDVSGSESLDSGKYSQEISAMRLMKIEPEKSPRSIKNNCGEK